MRFSFLIVSMIFCFSFSNLAWGDPTNAEVKGATAGVILKTNNTKSSDVESKCTNEFSKAQLGNYSKESPSAEQIQFMAACQSAADPDSGDNKECNDASDAVFKGSDSTSKAFSEACSSSSLLNANNPSVAKIVKNNGGLNTCMVNTFQCSIDSEKGAANDYYCPSKTYDDYKKDNEAAAKDAKDSAKAFSDQLKSQSDAAQTYADKQKASQKELRDKKNECANKPFEGNKTLLEAQKNITDSQKEFAQKFNDQQAAYNKCISQLNLMQNQQAGIMQKMSSRLNDTTLRSCVRTKLNAKSDDPESADYSADYQSLKAQLSSPTISQANAGDIRNQMRQLAQEALSDCEQNSKIKNFSELNTIGQQLDDKRQECASMYSSLQISVNSYQQEQQNLSAIMNNNSSALSTSQAQCAQDVKAQGQSILQDAIVKAGQDRTNNMQMLLSGGMMAGSQASMMGGLTGSKPPVQSGVTKAWSDTAAALSKHIQALDYASQSCGCTDSSNASSKKCKSILAEQEKVDNSINAFDSKSDSIRKKFNIKTSQ